MLKYSAAVIFVATLLEASLSQDVSWKFEPDVFDVSGREVSYPSYAAHDKWVVDLEEDIDDLYAILNIFIDLNYSEFDYMMESRNLVKKCVMIQYRKYIADGEKIPRHTAEKLNRKAEAEFDVVKNRINGLYDRRMKEKFEEAVAFEIQPSKISRLLKIKNFEFSLELERSEVEELKKRLQAKKETYFKECNILTD